MYIASYNRKTHMPHESLMTSHEGGAALKFKREFSATPETSPPPLPRGQNLGAYLNESTRYCESNLYANSLYIL